MGRTPSTTHRWLFCRALHLTPSPKKLGLALGKVFFETTETKETTAKQSIIRMIINFSVVPVVPAVSKQLISREAHHTFHLSVFSFHFVRVADTLLFTFHLSLFTLMVSLAP